MYSYYLIKLLTSAEDTTSLNMRHVPQPHSLRLRISTDQSTYQLTAHLL